MNLTPEEVSWILDALHSIDLFSFDPKQMENYSADIDMIIQSMAKERVEVGQPVIEEGQEGASLYLIRSGRAGVWVTRRGKRHKITSLGAGNYFGEISLLTEEPCTVTVIVEDESLEVYTLKAKVFRGIMKNNPRFSAHVMRMIADRLAERNNVIRNIRKDADAPK